MKDKATITAAEDWKHIFTNLPKFDAEDGHVIHYEVKETAINGYTSLISGDATNGYLVTNTKDTTPPNPNPNPSPNPGPSPSPSPRPTPGTPSTPTPGTPGTPTPLTPGVLGENRPTPVSEEKPVEEHQPEVLGESRDPGEKKNTRSTETGDHAQLILYATLFALSLLSSLLYFKRRKIG